MEILTYCLDHDLLQAIYGWFSNACVKVIDDSEDNTATYQINNEYYALFIHQGVQARSDLADRCLRRIAVVKNRQDVDRALRLGAHDVIYRQYPAQLIKRRLEDQLALANQRQLNQDDLINRLGDWTHRLLLQQGNETELINEILEELCQVIHVDRSYVFTINHQQNNFSCTHEYTADNVTAYINELQRLQFDEFPFASGYMLRGDPLIVHDVKQLPPEALSESREWTREGILSLINLPIRYQNKTIAFLGLDSVRQIIHWNKNLIRNLNIYAELIGGLLARNQQSELLYRREQELINTLELIGDAVFLLDDEGIILRANNKAESLTEEEEEPLIGRDFENCLEIVDDLSRENRIDSPEDLLSEQDTCHLHNCLLIGADLSNTPIELRATRIVGPAFETRGYLVVISDRSEAHSLEQQARHALRLDALGRLAGGIAHEFNNLLAAISGYSEVLQIQLQRIPEVPEKTHNLIGQVLQACERATGITSQMLAFSRHSFYEPRSMTVHETIDDLLQIILPSLPDMVKLSTTLLAQNDRIWGDPAQIQQIFLILITNARDALPEKNGTIHLSSENVEINDDIARGLNCSPGSMIRISVRDNGSGIEESIRDRIFEPFFSTKPLEMGNGLGLSCAYGLIQSHHGAIHCNSTVNQGSNFEVYLPISERRTTTDRLRRIKDSTKLRLHVLLVEDDGTVATYLQHCLNKLGCTCHTASTAEEAIEYYRENFPIVQIILLDFLLPDNNGRECYDALRAICAESRIIISTAYPSDETVTQLLGIANTGLLSKPFTLKQLEQCLSGLHSIN